MSALDTAVILYTVRNPEQGIVADNELSRLRKIEQAAKDVNEWLKRNNLGGTAHQRLLDEVLESE